MRPYLPDILLSTRERIDSAKKQRSFEDLDREAANVEAPRDFLAAIRSARFSIVAEIKRRSPSAGILAEGLSPSELAPAYETGGARALSVLTEPRFFSGSLDDLRDAKSAAALPVLRKDFTLDPYQIVEAREAGADAVLLIVAAVPDRSQLLELASAAEDYGLTTLVEVHEENELDLAFEVEPKLIGVNQRDLSTFEIDERRALHIKRHIPADVAMIAESGIGSRAQIEELESAGVDGALIGETLVKAADPAAKLAALLGDPGPYT